MAKNREYPSGLTELQQQLASPPASPIVPQSGDRDELLTELERLRKENAVLRQGLETPSGLSASKGQVRPYRVRLKDVKVKRTRRNVHVRLSAPAAYHQCPPALYDDLDLFIKEANGDPLRFEEAAWKRYLTEGHTVRVRDNDEKERERPLDSRDRVYFFVDAEGSEMVEHVDIPAISPADAYDLFCRLHVGGLRTIQRPEVEPLSFPAAQTTAA